MKSNLLAVLFVLMACLMTCTKELAPLGSAVFTVQNGGCEAPCEVSFSAADGSASYRWDFNDGSVATGQTAKKTYANAGSYTVNLVVSGDGGSAISSQPVSIRQKAAPATREYLLGVSFAKMVLVKGGTFDMGDTRNDNVSSAEKPVHIVTVSDFYMGQYEVTQRQWQNVMGSNPSLFTGYADHPVEQVSWDDIQSFLSKLNQQRPAGTPLFRLPTEAEWEYAAGGGAIASRTRFGNGKDIANPAEMNFYGLAAGKAPYSEVGIYRSETTQVGSFAPNALGLYDMSGNVWEWCQDWYGGYSSNPQTNPTGPGSGTDRLLRGGSWLDYPQNCRWAIRLSYAAPNRSGNVGFRLVSQSQ